MKYVPLLCAVAMIAACPVVGAGEPLGAGEGGGLEPGLLATFRDDVRSVTEVVGLPELGLAADETPHPAIGPEFSASYEGYLEVMQGGRYQFHGQGMLLIGGEVVTGERELGAGRHALQMSFQRTPGEVRSGLSWESEYFVREPVPPGAFWHLAGEVPVVAAADGGHEHPAPPQRIRHAFAEMKCAGCHDGNFLATLHHKYEPGSLLALMRHVNPPKWYGAMTGPRLDESELLVQLAADLRKLPNGDRKRGEGSATPNAVKNVVGTLSGYACIACHDMVQHRTPAESKGANLAFVTERVSYDWFVRWMNNPGRLQPGVPMPPFFVAQAPDERQESIDALWDYLAQGERMELPDELSVHPDQFILKPFDKPLFTRAYIRLPDGRELLRAICVGLPNGVSYCFDAESCRLVYVWTGGFLDMAPHWQNQSGMPTPAIGEAFHLAAEGEGLRIGDRRPAFRGYEVVDGIPRFEFAYGDVMVRLLIDAPTPEQVRQTFRVGGRTEAVDFIAPAGDAPVVLTTSLGRWEENRLIIDETGEFELVLSLERKQ